MQWAEGSGRTEQEEGKWTEERIRNFQAWCRRRTYEGKGWVPFAKGGENSPYYADIHLVVNWENEGEEMKSFAGSVIRNPDYYFRPGLFQTLRAARLAPHLTPVGCAFGHNGFQAFSLINNSIGLLALLNCSACEQLYKLQLGRHGYALYIAGALQQTPIPSSEDQRLINNAKLIHSNKHLNNRLDESSHAFSLPALVMTQGFGLIERADAFAKQAAEAEAELARIQTEIDEIEQ